MDAIDEVVADFKDSIDVDFKDLREELTDEINNAVGLAEEAVDAVAEAVSEVEDLDTKYDDLDKKLDELEDAVSDSILLDA